MVTYRSIVVGNSMAPYLKHGQTVMLKKVNSSTLLKIGQVVAMKTEAGVVVLHRFVGRKGNLFFTQGDNCSLKDKAWGRKDLQGIVVSAEYQGQNYEPRLAIERILGLIIPLRSRTLFRVVQKFFGNYAWRSAGLVQNTKEIVLSDLPRALATGESRWEHQQLGKELAIFDKKTGAVHMLNEVAGMIWLKAQGGEEPRQIMEELARIFPVISKKTLKEDLESTLKQLKEKQLV